MPKLRPETRVERRQELVEAAWRCAAVRGFSDLTVDDVCAEAGVSKGAFYGYFEQKQDLLLALLDDDAAALDRELERITSGSPSGVQRVRRFTEAMLARGEDAARVQVRADLWSVLLTEATVRRRLARVMQRRRALVRSWIEEAVASGELAEIPANALASILLALADGLVLHRALDPNAFQWRNISRAIDVLLAGVEGA
ncbi:MAG TPA: TetR/AcrR family transcriptional regulator [Solirubrobacter sp.]|nr:TetR/AcrR family transcriptional regulator [Solirubrobacter sp.]